MKFVQSIILNLLLYSVFFVRYSYEVLNKKLVAITLERPKVLYVNPKYAYVYNLTSLRHGRSDPMHYVHVCIEFFIALDNNNATITLNFYEFMSNDYRPSFFKWPFKLCTFLKVLKFNTLYSKNNSVPFQPHHLKFRGDNCHLEPGIYYFQNITMPVAVIPQSPFEKGRVFINYTTKNDEIIALAHMDVDFTMVPTRRSKN